MHSYLTRLGIRREVQEFFAPFYTEDVQGNLLFDYGDVAEHYGFAFHRIPVSENCWLAGNLDFNLVSKVFIFSSAMEAIAFYHFKYVTYPQPERILFLSLGCHPNPAQFRWIDQRLPGRDYRLVFGDTLPDKAGELVTAAALAKLPLKISFNENLVIIEFRLKLYRISLAAFSLHTFEKLSGYRFGIRTLRPKTGDSYFSQLKSAAFNH
jgi:hypothetical protein